MRIKLGKLAVQRNIKEGLFHGGVGPSEPLLHEVNARHGLRCKLAPAAFTFGVVRCDQRGPRSNTVHFNQELGLAGLFNAETRIKTALFHGLYALGPSLRIAHKSVEDVQSFLKRNFLF